MWITTIKNWLVDKWQRIKEWFKRHWKESIAVASVGTALAVGVALQPDIPFIEIEGQKIEFPYTDDNSNENLIIRTDRQVYTPLWAWNGFDVYVMVENKSGQSQPVVLLPYFSKDFTVEQIWIADPSATTTIDEPIYQQACTPMPTSTPHLKELCTDEQIDTNKKVVNGKWIPISVGSFSKKDYSDLVIAKNISVKPKIAQKASQQFMGFVLKDQISYYKIRMRSGEPFEREEFDIEAIGAEGAYGLIDPTIMTDNFNSYTDGNLDGQGGWGILEGSGITVQGTTVYEGAKAVQNQSNSANRILKTDTGVADGRTTIYIKVAAGIGEFWLREGTTHRIGSRLSIGSSSPNGLCYLSAGGASWVYVGPITANTWHVVEVEWRSSDKYAQWRIDSGTWSTWAAQYSNFTTNVNSIHLGLEGVAGANVYFDYIAQDPYVPPTAAAPPQIQVIIIE